MKFPAAICLAASLAAAPLWAQSGQDTSKEQSRRPNTHKGVSISGEVGSDGKTFTADNDSKVWQVANPAAFQGVYGRHLTIKANLNPTENGIQVLTVKAFREQSTGVKFDDAAFRR